MKSFNRTDPELDNIIINNLFGYIGFHLSELEHYRTISLIDIAFTGRNRKGMYVKLANNMKKLINAYEREKNDMDINDYRLIVTRLYNVQNYLKNKIRNFR